MVLAHPAAHQLRQVKAKVAQRLLATSEWVTSSKAQPLAVAAVNAVALLKALLVQEAVLARTVALIKAPNQQWDLFERESSTFSF